MHRSRTRLTWLATALISAWAPVAGADGETPRGAAELSAPRHAASKQGSQSGDVWQLVCGTNSDLLAIRRGALDIEYSRYHPAARDVLTGAGVKPAATGHAPTGSAAPPAAEPPGTAALLPGTAVAALALSGVVLTWEARRRRPAPAVEAAALR